MIELIKSELRNYLDKLDSGNSNASEEQLKELMYFIRSLNSEEMSAEQSAKYLGVCTKTFSKYVDKGLIPEGRKEPGKTRYWLKSDLDKLDK